jgi:hypothetical protein
VIAMIEVFQFLRHMRGLAPGERPSPGSFRVGVVVSAWDSVAPEWRREGPAAYCSEFAPLLRDFLWSNFHLDDAFHFGISSTGGDLHSKSFAAQYKRAPGGFVEWSVSNSIVQSSDLSIPVAWALFGLAGDSALVAD